MSDVNIVVQAPPIITVNPNLPGKSAYEVAVANGYVGTVVEWLASLQGANGKSAYQIAVENGFQGTEQEWIASLIGADGKSAYQIAVEKGYIGTEVEWIASLQGEDGITPVKGVDYIDGADGQSTYVYIAYASDNLGTGFSNVPSAALNYIAVKTTTEPIANPIVSDFTGLWKKYANTDGASLLGTYTHLGNKEVHVSAVDVVTNIFTSVGHGLVTGDRLNVVQNQGVAGIYLIDKLPGGLGYTNENSTGKHYVKVIDPDTFTVSLSNGGADIDIITNANMDLTKWHFEKCGDITSIVFSNFPEGIRRIKARIIGKGTNNQNFCYFKPNNINSGGFCVSQNQGGVSNYPIAAQLWPIYGFGESIIDTNGPLTYFNFWSSGTPNTASSNTQLSRVPDIQIDFRYSAFDIVSITFACDRVLTNGTTIQIYNDAGGTAINGIPTGGEAGQQLVKKSAVDYDTEWKTLDEPIATYIHSGNKEAVVSAVDTDTNTFTSIGHPFINGDRVTPFFNNDNAAINYNLKYFPGALTQGQFYIIDATTDTFRISTTLGGGVLSLSNNTDMDLSKWHFEKSVDTIYINDLPDVQKLKIVVYGQAPSGSYILPNNASNYASATFMQTGNNIITRYPSISYGGMLSHIEAIIDSTDWLTISASGYKIVATSATANTVSLVNVTYIHTLDRNFTFNSIKMPTFYPANGLRIEVYKL